MGTLPPEEVLRLWAGDAMPLEMAMGHVLQNLVRLQTTLTTQHGTIRQLQAELARLIEPADHPPTPRQPKPRKPR